MVRRHLAVSVSLVEALRRRFSRSLGERSARRLDAGDVWHGRDTRLIPAALTVWGAMWVVTLGELQWAVGIGAAAVGMSCFAWWRRSAAVALTAVVLLAAVVAGLLRVEALTAGPVPALADTRAVVRLAVVVDSEPRRLTSSRGWGDQLRFNATVVELDGRGEQWRTKAPISVIVTGSSVDQWESVVVGATVTANGRLGRATVSEGVSAEVRMLGPPTTIKGPTLVLAAVEQIRTHLHTAMNGSPAEQAALVPALTVGDTTAVTPELANDFRATGLTHLMAVSGANLTLMLSFLGLLLRSAGASTRTQTVVSLVAVAGFVVLCRSEPSVLRAAAMGIVALAALQRRTSPGSLRHLALAVMVLCVADPWLARSWGFALSVSACAGIIVWSGRWAETMSGWLPRWLAEAISVPLAAQLATQPLVTALSGTVSLAGVPANMLAAGFVGPATIAGLMTAVVAWPLPIVGNLIGWVAGWLAQPILWVCHGFAALPGAVATWPADPLLLMVLTLGCWGLATAMPSLLQRPLVVLVSIGVLVAALLRPTYHPGWPPPQWFVIACDVGQGDATAIQVAPHQAILVDTGPDPQALIACLDQADISVLPLVVLTHFHADHIGGFGQLLAARRVEAVMVSPLASPAASAAWVADQAGARGIPVRQASPGEDLQIGAARWETLAAGALADGAATDEGESSVENNSSIVARVTVAGVSVLLTGDAEPAEQDAILAAGIDVRATIVKVPHHGSGRQSPAFIAATGARIALIEVGQDNPYGHPSAKTLRLLKKSQMTVARTDQSGAIGLSLEADQLKILAVR